MTKQSVAQFRPVGVVENGTIRVDRRWAAGLTAIEGFSHLIVIYWLNEARRLELKIHPKGDRRIPLLGFWATRTPHRPNPIGLTVVRLVKRRGARLWVEGLDAWNGTPVLDIKPYTRKDAIKRFRIPAWVKLLDQAETDPLRRYAS